MTQFVGMTGIRMRSGIPPDARGRGVSFGLRPALAAVLAVAVIGIPVAVANVIIRDESAN